MKWVSRVRAWLGWKEPAPSASSNPELAREQAEVDTLAERVAVIEKMKRRAPHDRRAGDHR